MRLNRFLSVFMMLLFVGLVEINAKSQLPIQQPLKIEARCWIKDKPNQPWTWFDTQVVDSIKDYLPSKIVTNAYGSRKDSKLTATGFFRVENVNNRWWFVDPEGYLNIQRGVTGFRQGNSIKNKIAFNSIYRDTKNWTKESYVQFTGFGFNGVGSWSDIEAVQAESKQNDSKLSYSLILNFMSNYGKQRGGTYQLAGNTGYPNQCIFVFDKAFEQFCDEYASKIISYKNDPNLLGYFSDNEIPFGLANLQGYLTLSEPADPGRKFAENWLKQKKISPLQITDIVSEEFAGVVAEYYYRIVSKAIRKYDHHHLFLGSRLHGSPKNTESIIKAAGKHCDVISINYYGSWSPDPELMEKWRLWANKPFMITEFYTKAMDSGLANTTGAGFTVHTQEDRGFAYQNFCLGLLQSGNCVGWHWFKYQDNDPTAKDVDPSNIDSNKGLLNSNYQWYIPMIKSMVQLNNQVYSLIDFFDRN